MSPHEFPEHLPDKFERISSQDVDLEKAPDDAIGVDFTFTLSGRIKSGVYVGTAKPPRSQQCVLQFSWQTPKRRRELPKFLLLHHLDNKPTLKGTEWHSASSTKRPRQPPMHNRERYLERKRRILQATRPKTPLRAKALAMCEFDKQTDPDFLQTHHQGKAAKQVRELANYLRFRWLQRAGWAVHDREFEPIAHQDDAVRTTATAIEKLARKALRTAFPRRADPDRVNLRLLEATFAAFVAGELRMTLFTPPPPPAPDPLADDGIPDGDYYFSFAESALLFVRLGLHADFWQRVLPIFVCGDGFFASCFWNRTARRRDAYRPAFCKPDAAVNSSAILVWHEQRIRPMSLAQLAAEHSRAVGFAICKDAARPRPVCTAKEFQ